MFSHRKPSIHYQTCNDFPILYINIIQGFSSCQLLVFPSQKFQSGENLDPAPWLLKFTFPVTSISSNAHFLKKEIGQNYLAWDREAPLSQNKQFFGNFSKNSSALGKRVFPHGCGCLANWKHEMNIVCITPQEPMLFSSCRVQSDLRLQLL